MTDLSHGSPQGPTTREQHERVFSELESRPRVAILVPAHNEADLITATVKSLFASSYKPARVIVMSDNSTDDTVALARAAGAEVHETMDNSARKAGAINQGLDLLLPTLDDGDVVMTMDADGVIDTDCIQNVLEVFEERERVGGVCAAARSRPQTSYIEAAQAIEYEKGRRITSRKQGEVFVLSGAASFFPVHVLREVAEARGRQLPGTRGKVTLEHSLVEDYELTLAVKALGHQTFCKKNTNVTTDLMPTIADFEQQRLRWLRGTFETLALYGWKPYTRRTIVGIGFNMFSAVLLPLAVLASVFGYLAFGSVPTLVFLLLTPIFMVENIMAAHKIGGFRPKVLAWTFFPMWAYDLAQATVYWRSLIFALTNRRQKW